jgi:ABC-type polysaccharide/polyol phosphate transport system ATPase subunit
MRIAAPTESVARIRGRVAALLEVGTGFHPDLTGREKVFLNAAILGMSRADTVRPLRRDHRPCGDRTFS